MHGVPCTRFHFDVVEAGYVAEQDVSVDVPGDGTLKADIVFGGNYFAILKWDDPNLKIE